MADMYYKKNIKTFLKIEVLIGVYIDYDNKSTEYSSQIPIF